MPNNKIVRQFTILTFTLAYLISTILIFLGQFGYKVHNWVYTFEQLLMNIPFALYILSPAIASYIVLKKNKKVTGIMDWLKIVFHMLNSPFSYLYVVTGLLLYFSMHIIVSQSFVLAIPLYTFFLSLPGNLIIGGMEEAGWMYILQPKLYRKHGYIKSSLMTGLILLLWHIPLFFIPGTNHGEGHINFWMFAIQLFSFRFFYGSIIRISRKGRIFLGILFHTMFNAASLIFGNLTMTWSGTIVANTAVIILSFGTMFFMNRKNLELK